MKTLSVGQLAKGANVNIETVRYYERKGLLPEPKRRESGYREYSLEDVFRLKFMLRFLLVWYDGMSAKTNRGLL